MGGTTERPCAHGNTVKQEGASQALPFVRMPKKLQAVIELEVVGARPNSANSSRHVGTFSVASLLQTYCQPIRTADKLARSDNASKYLAGQGCTKARGPTLRALQNPRKAIVPSVPAVACVPTQSVSTDRACAR